MGREGGGRDVGGREMEVVRDKFCPLSDLCAVVILTQPSQYLQHIRERWAGQTLSPLVGLKTSSGPAADGEGTSQHHKKWYMVH